MKTNNKVKVEREGLNNMFLLINIRRFCFRKIGRLLVPSVVNSDISITKIHKKEKKKRKDVFPVFQIHYYERQRPKLFSGCYFYSQIFNMVV